MSNLDTTRIGVLPNKYFLGIKSLHGPHFDKKGMPFSPVAQDVVSIREMLATEHHDDAHLTCYNVAGQEAWPTIRKEARVSVEKEAELTLSCFVLDLDNADHEKWNDELFDTNISAFYSLDDNPILGQWSAFYTTGSGARVIYIPEEPVPVMDAEQYLVGLIKEFEKAGVEADPSCKDWTRRFRCPRVIRDGKRTSASPYFMEDTREGAVLDMSLVEKKPTRILPTLRTYDASGSSRLEVEEIEAFLQTSKNGRQVQSQFYKDAKTALKNTQAYHCLFSEDILLAEGGNRNDTIMNYLGQCIPILLRKVPYTSPEHVYALFFGPITALEQDQDWFSHTWNAIMAIWPVEVEKINAERVEKAEKETEALTDIEEMARGMKDWCTHSDLDADDLRVPFVLRHLLASCSNSNFFFAMGRDGCYSPFPLGRSDLIPRIRTTFLKNIIETTEYGQNGKPQDVAAVCIQNAYSTPIRAIEMVPQLECDGMIDDMDKANPVLKLPMYRRSSAILPEYSEDVDIWLTLFFGNHYDEGCNWIANALAFEEGPICALSIAAPPGIGKKLLTEGLSECLEMPLTATGSDIIGDFNGSLGKTPFLCVNESWPKAKVSSAPFELFKMLTAGDKTTIKEKFKPNVQVINPMRVIMTANNHDMVRTLLSGKEMSPDDKRAVGERLLHFDLGPEAAAHLEELGGNAFTGKKGARWIAGIVEPSNYIVAKHFLWLYAQREVEEGGFRGRYLVAGNCAGDSQFMQQQIVTRNTTSIVILAALGIIESKSARHHYMIDEGTGALYVTVQAIREELEILDNPMEFGTIVQVMRNIVLGQEPIVVNHLEWHELDCQTLLTFAQTLGKDTPNLRAIRLVQLKAENN